MPTLLEPEQEQLLARLVKAHQATPQRQKFFAVQTFGGSGIIHPGFGGENLDVYFGDVEALARSGLLHATADGSGTLAFDISPQGFAYYREKLEPNVMPNDKLVEEQLNRVGYKQVLTDWETALARRLTDPDGAITAAKTLLESVCKHILKEAGVAYSDNKDDLPRLYSLATQQMAIASGQQTDEPLRKILGGCQTIVENIGTLRNRVGDAHGKGPGAAVVEARHAALAVNGAGAAAAFLVASWEGQRSS